VGRGYPSKDFGIGVHLPGPFLTAALLGRFFVGCYNNRVKLINIQQKTKLAPLTSFRVGGDAKFFFEAKTNEEVGLAMMYAYEESLPLFILGGGTNILVSDGGFDGIAIKPNIKNIKPGEDFLSVGSGASMESVLDYCLERGFSGLEWSGGLPGTIGGAVRGNAGAFGGEISNIISEVLSINVIGVQPKLIRRSSKDCNFSYRSSLFKTKEEKEIITEVVLRFDHKNKDELRRVAQEKIQYRAANHPLEYPNAGSIFKNIKAQDAPEELFERAQKLGKLKGRPERMMMPTAFVIEETDLKGFSIGGAEISTKHANFIVNKGRATAKDIFSLINLVKEKVAKKWKLDLEEEIQYLGF